MSSRADISTLNCSLARALAAVGDAWSLLILRDAMMGATRFGQFQASLGAARNILSARLASLVESGVLHRDASGGHPRYTLTEKGRDLTPALVALLQWGDVWESQGMRPVTVCDPQQRAVAPVAVQDRDGAALDPRKLVFKPGPGANPATISYLQSLAASATDVQAGHQGLAL